MPELIAPSDIISRAWENFRKHLRSYVEFVVWIALLSLLQWTLSIVLRSAVDDKYMRLAVFVMASVPIGLMFAVLGGAMIDFTANALQKKKVGVRESLFVGLHKLLPLVWVSILVSLAIFFGFIAFVIPALLFFVWFKFASYHLIVEGVRGTDSLRASKSLVDGRWWAVLWRVLVPVVFFTMASAFITAVVYLVVGAALGDPRLFFGTVTDYEQLSNTHTLITAVVPQVVDGFAVALFLGADLTLWLDLRKKA